MVGLDLGPLVRAPLHFALINPLVVFTNTLVLFVA